MATQPSNSDSALLRELQRMWERYDAPSVDLSDRMVVAVASADLSEEYAMLTLVENGPLAAVRSDTDRLTLQFTHGTVSLLVHVTETETGRRRIDGWIDGKATDVQLIHEAGGQSARAVDGRFAFDAVPAGVARLRITLDDPADSDNPVMMTPRFEL